jgi:hypothetical protein
VCLLQALHDQYRIQFYHAYLNNACQAIERYGLNVKKMFAWTFLDNFEWVSHDPVLNSEPGTPKRRDWSHSSMTCAQDCEFMLCCNDVGFARLLSASCLVMLAG